MMDLAHDAGFPRAADAAETAPGEAAAEFVAVREIGGIGDGGGAENADVSGVAARERRVVGLDHGGSHAGAAGIRQPLAAGDAQGVKNLVRGVHLEQEILVPLVHGPHSMEVDEQVEQAVPRAVGIEQDGRFVDEVAVHRLVSDKDRNRLEEVLDGRTGGEDEGIGLDDLALDVRERDALVAVGVIDVPAASEEVVEQAGADFPVGIPCAADGSR
jgi:hypothetical protein